MNSNERNSTQSINPVSDYSNLETLILQRKRHAKGRKVRTAEKILRDILEACRTPSMKHWIMIKANLGDETFSLHTEKLLKEGKMTCKPLEEEEKPGRRPKLYYSDTEEGLSYLDRLKEEE